MRVYLAGPITGLTYKGATDWRTKMADELREIGHATADPMRGKEYLRNLYKNRRLTKGTATGFSTDEQAVLDAKSDGLELSYEQFPMSSAKGIFGRDTFDVATCDVVLANFAGARRVSIGTCMEVQRAFDLGKYVLVVIEPSGNPNDHPFVRGAASLCVDDLETAFDVMAVLGEPYK